MDDAGAVTHLIDVYVPSNLLPIMITDGWVIRLNSTIMAGIILLWKDGSIPVAMVIFLSPVSTVPSLKMIALGWLCWDAAGRGERNAADSERMHLLYEVVEFVGCWSMIDVFIIAALVWPGAHG